MIRLMIDRLKAAGFDQNQAEALAGIITDAIALKFQQELLPIKTDLALLKWMMETLISGMKT